MRGRRRLVEAYERPTARSATGGLDGDLVFIARLWAHVEELRSEEKFLVGGNQKAATHRFRFRTTRRVTDTNRLRYGDEDHEVVAVRDVDSTGRELEVLTKLARKRIAQ